MSLFDLFTQKAPESQAAAQQQVPAQQAAQQAAPPGNMQQPNTAPAQTSGTDPNGVVPQSPAEPAPATPTADNSPLEQFKDLWQTTPKDPSSPGDFTPSNLNPETVNKAVAKADFAGVISQEHLAAIAAGGEQAQQAFTESLNAVARQVLAQSTLVSNKMIADEVSKALDATQSKIPDLVRQHSLTESVQNSNPLFKNPAVKPIIEATKSQLAQKYPEATAAEITEMTTNYVTAMAESLSPQKAPVSNPANSETDWGAFLES